MTLGDLKFTDDYRLELLYLLSRNAQYTIIMSLKQQQMLSSLEKGNKHFYGSKNCWLKKCFLINQNESYTETGQGRKSFMSSLSIYINSKCTNY